MPAPGSHCARNFRVGFVTDLAQLNSSVDAAGWAGAQSAAKQDGCIELELLRSSDPGGYRQNLEALAARDDLVIAGSFLLTEAVELAATSRPSTQFLLVDPLVLPPLHQNLEVVSFREDQAAFLAGALAAMTSRTRVLGGVYGLEGGAMSRYRRGFEQGALAVDPALTVLGAYQPASEGPPFGNPGWGEAQGRTWLALGADVIFGAGGSTGEGALLAAASAHRLCIGAGSDQFLTDAAARSCLLTSAVTHPEQALQSAIEAAAQGRWTAGAQYFGIRQAGVGLAGFHLFDSSVTPSMRSRLALFTGELAAGKFLEGN